MANENIAGPNCYVPLLNTSSESEQAVEPAKKPRGKGRVWIFEKKFTTLCSAEEFIKNENTWTKYNIHMTQEGVKRYYRCNKVKINAKNQCSASIHLLCDATTENVLVFRTDLRHDHDIINTQSTNRLDEKTKKEIEKLFELHLKPKSIMHNLSQIDGIFQPTKLQLNNYLQKLRKKKFGPTMISLGELEAWLINKSQVPVEDHQVFVVAYELHEEDRENPRFRFMLSTKHLLGLSRQSTVLHADATYKLIWQGFPVLVIGTTDGNKHFHPFGLAVTTTERTEDFIFLFSALKNAALSLYSHPLKCEVLVCDAAKSIQTAFARTFGTDAVIRMCWAHAKRRMQTKVDQILQKETRIEILRDIDDLQCASTPSIFDKACEKFCQKWDHEKDFLAYFESEWLILNRCWYLGAYPRTPATNNALESFNKTIKDSGTFRERHPLARFLAVASDMIRNWSNEYEINPERRFDLLPTVSLKIWTESFQWAKLSKQVELKNNSELFSSYRVPAGSEMECKNYEKPWDTFDEYKEQHFSEWEVLMPREKQNWLHGRCNCPKFLKDYICKHLVGLAIRLRHVQPPPEAKIVPIGMKRKRGRPAKAKKALIVQ